jgi:hypothetical protein
MRRLAFLLFTAFSLSAGTLLGQNIYCLYETSPVTIDGKPDEWPQIFSYYDGNTKLQFAFANDTGNLYVCLKITDDPTQLRLFNGGLGIWIDPKGKKKETVGISFPLKGDRTPGEGGGEGGGKHKRQSQGMEETQDPRLQKADAVRLKQHAFLTQTTIRVKGFAGVPEQSLPLKNDFGINVSFNWDSLNILTIEYKFPIALVLGHSLTPADTLKPLAVAFIEPALEGIKMPANDEDNSITGPSSQNTGMNRGMGSGGMGGGMNNGMGGGGMGGGGRGGGGGNHSSSMPSQNPATMEQKLWSKVFLTLYSHAMPTY